MTLRQRLRHLWQSALAMDVQNKLVIALIIIQAATLYYAVSAAHYAEYAYDQASEASYKARECESLSYSMDKVQQAAEKAASSCVAAHY